MNAHSGPQIKHVAMLAFYKSDLIKQKSMSRRGRKVIHYCMYAYINLLSKVGFHSITSNYESENNRKTFKFRFHSIKYNLGS